MTAADVTLYGSELSGHTHRVELMLRALDLPYRFVSSPARARRTPEFLALNPLGQVPVLQDGDVVLADSNAILVYLAKRHAAGMPWLPDAAAAAARVQRWLAIAAAEMRFGPAAARAMTVWNFPGNMADAHAIAGRLFRFVNDHLAD